MTMMALGPPIQRRVLTRHDLRKLGRRAARLLGPTDALHHIAKTGALVLKEICGREWTDRAVFGPKAAFLGVSDTQPHSRLRMCRTLELAEMLFNFQHEAWFPRMVKRLIEGDVEACFSELEIASLLKDHGVAFDLNTPEGKANADIDFVIYKKGMSIATEVKCKVESTAVSKNGITNRLKKAQKDQLPPDRPGVIFMRVPETWMPQGDADNLVEEAVDKFLRGTSRVISVVVLTTRFDHSEQFISNFGNIAERVNPKQKFGPNLAPLITKSIFFPINHLNFAVFFWHVPEPTLADRMEVQRIFDNRDEDDDDDQAR
jgi:hypothetical protein